MAIQFVCKNCGKQISVRDEFAGKKGKCPQCATIVEVPAALSPPPPSNAAKWHVLLDNDVTSGPFTQEQINSMVQAGQVGHNTRVWTAGSSDWAAASTFPELSPLLATAPLNPPVAPASADAHLGGAPPATPKLSTVAADKVKTASKDALQAFKMFVSNPVANLSVAFESLGQARALGVGIIFGVAFALCLVFGAYRFSSGWEYGGFLPEWGGQNGFNGFIRLLVTALVPFAGLFAASFVVRKAFRGVGSLSNDSFIAGASLLPLGFVALLAGILGLGNSEVIAAFMVYAGCLCILMLFSGLTRICKISERAVTLALPLMLSASAWLSKIIYTAMLRNL